MALAVLLLLIAMFPPRRLAHYDPGHGYDADRHVTRKLLFLPSFHEPEVVLPGSIYKPIRVWGRAEVDVGHLAAEALAVIAVAALWTLAFAGRVVKGEPRRTPEPGAAPEQGRDAGSS
jgi:hypothetical protein